MLRVNCLYLWTKRGASRHCKMLGTDKKLNIEDFSSLKTESTELHLANYFIEDFSLLKGRTPTIRKAYLGL